MAINIGPVAEPKKAQPKWTPVEKNGVKEYKPGTTGAKVWAIAAKHTKDGAVDVAAVHKGCKGIVKGSINAALVTYRKHHGVVSLKVAK